MTEAMTIREKIRSLENVIEQLNEIIRKLKLEEMYEGWCREEAEMKKEIPDFSLFRESRNKEFCAYLASGHTVKEAYEAAHRRAL